MITCDECTFNFGLSCALHAFFNSCLYHRDHRLNRSREIPPEAVGIWIFDRSFNFDNWQPTVANDIISGVVVQDVGLDVVTKLGDSRLNRSRDIRLPHFLTNERRTTTTWRTRVITHHTNAQASFAFLFRPIRIAMYVSRRSAALRIMVKRRKIGLRCA